MLSHICTSLCWSLPSVKENQPFSPAKFWAFNVPEAGEDWASASVCGGLWTWGVFISWVPSSAFPAVTVTGLRGHSPARGAPHTSCLLALSWTSHNHAKRKLTCFLHHVSVMSIKREIYTGRTKRISSISQRPDIEMTTLIKKKAALNLQRHFISQNKIFSMVLVKFAFIKEIYLTTVHKSSPSLLKRVIHKAVSQHSCSQIKMKTTGCMWNCWTN